MAGTDSPCARVLAEDGVNEVPGRADRGKHDVPAAELGGRADHLGSQRGERLRLGPGAGVDGNVTAGLEQPPDQLEAHPPGTQPAQPEFVTVPCHQVTPCANNRLHEV
jgi:hypothetical protein